MRASLLALFAFFLSACATASAQPRREAVITAANPHAAAAGAEMLRRGGTATDAAIAAMLVLGLVEPQSAGLGGGGFLLHYDAGARSLDAYDGREIAPQGARPDMFLDARGEPLTFLEARKSGTAIGAPALVPMLKMVHDAHGQLPWHWLFDPAIRLAERGFPVSPRLHRIISGSAARNRLRDSPSARAYLFTPDGEPLPVGHILRNRPYAETLRAIARQGPRALTQGRIAQDIVAAAQAEPRPGTLTLADLARVQPRRLEAICGTFRLYRVCSMPPPSAGGVAVIQVLGLFERARPQPRGVQDTDDWAAFLWSSRLAYADRDHYLADDQFVPVPVQGLIDPRYIDARARLITLASAPRGVSPGDPSLSVGGPSLLDHWGRDLTREAAGTTHLSVIDGAGNVVALTATIEAEFGAHRMAGGFFLNNELTDFNFRPTLNGRPVANAVAPGKRPRSSMAPVLMFEPDGDFHAAIGSPGGTGIIAYVARTIVGVVDWDLSMQQAIEVPHLIASSPMVRQEATASPELLGALRARGWNLRQSEAEDSGLHGFVVTQRGIDAGADPRREGAVVRVRR